jgi:hypothetical protein
LAIVVVAMPAPTAAVASGTTSAPVTATAKPVLTTGARGDRIAAERTANVRCRCHCDEASSTAGIAAWSGITTAAAVAAAGAIATHPADPTGTKTVRAGAAEATTPAEATTAPRIARTADAAHASGAANTRIALKTSV